MLHWGHILKRESFTWNAYLGWFCQSACNNVVTFRHECFCYFACLEICIFHKCKLAFAHFENNLWESSISIHVISHWKCLGNSKSLQLLLVVFDVRRDMNDHL